MSDNERPEPEEGCEPSESKGCCDPSEFKGCCKGLPRGGWVKFCRWPLLRPLKLTTGNWTALWDACKRREWELADDWCVKIAHTKRAGLNGTIVIPKGTVVDGASVPLPWLISFLTLGILRPTGILLIPSIVHDYAYEHGYLPYRIKGVVANQKISREDADWLFREMIQGINHTKVGGHIAWLAVRLGWWFSVKYDDAPRGGKPPYGVLVYVLVALVVLVAALRWADSEAALLCADSEAALRCADFPWWVIVLTGGFLFANIVTSIASRRKNVRKVPQ